VTRKLLFADLKTEDVHTYMKSITYLKNLLINLTAQPFRKKIKT